MNRADLIQEVAGDVADDIRHIALVFMRKIELHDRDVHVTTLTWPQACQLAVEAHSTIAYKLSQNPRN